MKVDLLKRLKTLLEEDANNEKGVKFSLSAWARPDDGSCLRMAYDLDNPVVPVSCGTFACALGLAAISGAFKEDGLAYTISDQDYEPGKGMLVPTFNGLEDFEAGAEFFGLTHDQNHFLFDPYEYDRTEGKEAELEVIKRIQFLIDGGDESKYPKPEH